MQVVIIRHIKSSWENPALSDFERPILTKRCKDAKLIALHLKNLGFKPDKTIVSSAKRTKQTADEIHKHLDIRLKKALYLDELYECSANVLKKVILDNIKNVNSLLIIGHNPAITDFVNQISSEYIPNIPTTGCVSLTITEDIQRINFIISPKKLRAIK
jgi:phosphohistidine phosphatase